MEEKMLDLKFVRENPDIVKQNIKNKFQDRKLPLVDEVIELDAQARATKTEADELRANRNKLSKQTALFVCLRGAYCICYNKASGNVRMESEF